MESNKQGLSQNQQHSQLEDLGKLIKIKLEKSVKTASSTISVRPKRSMLRVKSVKKLKVLNTSTKKQTV